MRTLLLAAGAAMLLASPASPSQLPDAAPPLADPPGITQTVTVSNAGELAAAVQNLQSNTKVVLQPGVYQLQQQLWITGAQNVVFRGATGNRADVVVQGHGMSDASVPHGFEVANAQNLLFADLSVGAVYYHPFQLHGELGCANVRIYNCRIFDAGEQLVKGTFNFSPNTGVNGGRVEYCVIEYTTTARSDYTNGVDVLAGDDWVIRHNLFRNIRAPAGGGLAGPAILMWAGCENTLVEGNTFVNCERGVSLGLIDQSGAIPYDHVGGIVRNNVFYRRPGQSGDVGIHLADCPNARVLNNTVICSGTYGAPIEIRYPQTTGAVVANNLCDGQILVREGASGSIAWNFIAATDAMFVDAAGGDYHLAATAVEAIDQGDSRGDVAEDWDGGARPQGAGWDLGADERGSGPGGGGGAPVSGGGGGGGSCSATGALSGAIEPDALRLGLVALALVLLILGARSRASRS